MKKRIFNYLCLMFILLDNLAYGESLFKDNILMNCSEYKAHHKKIVVFPHLKHTKIFNVSCGECHHHDNGEAIEDLKIGDDVGNCIECHSIPAYVTGKSYEEQLEYHTNTLHLKCKECHRRKNKKRAAASGIKAPVKCYGCH